MFPSREKLLSRKTFHREIYACGGGLLAASINTYVTLVCLLWCGCLSVRRGDVLSAWSGIRPLVTNPNSKDTQSLARNHVIEVSDNNLITIAGRPLGLWDIPVGHIRPDIPPSGQFPFTSRQFAPPPAVQAKISELALTNTPNSNRLTRWGIFF